MRMIVVLAMVAGAGVGCGLGQAAPAASVDAFHALNAGFVPAYVARAGRLGETNPPYVEVAGDSLELHLHGQAGVKAQVLTDRYQHLKDVAHVPFTIYLMLTGRKDGAVGEEDAAKLRALLEKVKVAEAGLDAAGFEEGERGRQKEILARSRQMIEGVLGAGRVDAGAVGAFAKAMGPLLMKNADAAGCEQVKTMHAQMMQWKAVMSKEEWGSFAVVIRAPHQPRYRNVDTQYFGWLLGGERPKWSYPGESARVIYAETVFGNQGSGDMLLSVLVDFEAGQAFMGKKWRLSEDILSDGAARCLKGLDKGDRMKE